METTSQKKERSHEGKKTNKPNSENAEGWVEVEAFFNLEKCWTGGRFQVGVWEGMACWWLRSAILFCFVFLFFLFFANSIFQIEAGVW